MKRTVLLLPFLCLFITGCSNNNKPVSYVKDVVATREGDGYEVYFVLADDTGEPTAVNGRAVLNFEVQSEDPETYVPLHTDSRSLFAEDFQVATVGRGPFEHKTLLYYFGRYPDETFQSKGASSEFRGRARITFSEDEGGKTVGGQTNISYY